MPRRNLKEMESNKSWPHNKFILFLATHKAERDKPVTLTALNSNFAASAVGGDRLVDWGECDAVEPVPAGVVVVGSSVR